MWGRRGREVNYPDNSGPDFPGNVSQSATRGRGVWVGLEACLTRCRMGRGAGALESGVEGAGTPLR